MKVATTLRRGSRGPEVLSLQKHLNEALRLAPPLVMDGNFGPATEAALKTYQASIGRRSDGITGADVLAALRKLLIPWHKAGVAAAPGKEPPWLTIAKHEIGQKEEEGPRSNPKILEYFTATTFKTREDETPWCSAFANWCMKKAGIAGTKSAAAISWTHWGKPLCAAPGAITVIHNPKAAGSRLTASGYHVGFLIEESHSHYRLLGGNQSNQVKYSNFSKASWRLAGYRWPNL